MTPPPLLVEVHAATPSDRGALQRLLLADCLERGAVHDAAAAAGDVERAVEIALSVGSAAWLVVAASHGMVVGVLLANPAVSTASGGALLRVETLYVPPEKRRRGVARALLRHVADEARLNGMGSVELELDPSTAAAPAARALLASTGARPLGLERHTLRLCGSGLPFAIPVADAAIGDFFRNFWRALPKRWHSASERALWCIASESCCNAARPLH